MGISKSSVAEDKLSEVKQLQARNIKNLFVDIAGRGEQAQTASTERELADIGYIRQIGWEGIFRGVLKEKATRQQ